MSDKYAERTALLPCPFCRGKAGMKGVRIDHEQPSVFCVECYAEVPFRGLHHDSAVAAWNKRSGDEDALNCWADMMDFMNIGGTLDLAIKLTRGEASRRAIKRGIKNGQK